MFTQFATEVVTGSSGFGIDFMPVAQAYCPPKEFTNGLDTAKFWTTLVAVAAGVIGLIIIGIGLFFEHNRHDGGQMMKKLFGWMLGAVIVSAATTIASIFLNVTTSGCLQR